MTIEQLEKGKTLTDGITYLEDLKVTFGLTDNLHKINPDKFRELLIDNQDKIGDMALEFVGDRILEWFDSVIAQHQADFEAL